MSQSASQPSSRPSNASFGPDEQASVRSALLRYRVLAYATGTFLVLLTVNIVLKYVLKTGHLGAWVAIGHGWLFLLYCISAVDLWFRTRVDLLRMIGVAVAGVVPFMTFVAERWVTRTVRALLGDRPATAAGAA